MAGTRPLSDQELELVKGSFSGRYSTRDQALFTLGVRSGFRISELLSLRVKDVYRDGKVLGRVSVPRRSMKAKRSGRSVARKRPANDRLAFRTSSVLTRLP